MTTIFDVVQAMSGQKNVIVIPVPYLDFFKGDQQAHALSAILNQLVFWSGVSSSADDGWFYKSHEELAEEIHGLSGEEQARRLVDKLRKKYFPGVIETKTKKVNGTPVTHYKIDGNKLISMIFPSISETSKVRNPIFIQILTQIETYRSLKTLRRRILTNPATSRKMIF